MTIDEMKEYVSKFSDGLEEIEKLDKGRQLKAYKSFMMNVFHHLDDFKDKKEMVLYCLDWSVDDGKNDIKI